MTDDAHPLKQAVIDLGTWVDRWCDERLSGQPFQAPRRTR
jgi:hypothetical protein